MELVNTVFLKGLMSEHSMHAKRKGQQRHIFECGVQKFNAGLTSTFGTNLSILLKQKKRKENAKIKNPLRRAAGFRVFAM